MNRFLPTAVLAALLLSQSAHAAPPVATIGKMPPLVHAQRPMTLDGSASTKGAGVTFLWTVEGQKEDILKIEDADKPIARFTPPKWGVYNVTLAVTQ